MTGEIASAGDIATGALVSRAVEPGAGEDSHAPTSAACLNCGTRLAGQFCHHCGQNGHVHRTVGAIAHDLMHGVLHLEGKTWRTLPMLAFKPGHLTRRYAAGERARFVSPMAVFLFSVFLMFAVVAQLPGWKIDSGFLTPGVAEGMAQARTKLADERARASKSLTGIRETLAEERAEEHPEPDRIARLQQRAAGAEKAIRELDQAEKMISPDTIAHAPKGMSSDIGWFQAKFEHAKANPQLVLYKIKANAYKFSWALIPLSLPFIWILFPLRRDVGLYDHAIFATYSLGFMSLLVIVLALLAALGAPRGLVWTAAVVIVPFHIYKQLKYGYNLSRGGALWRTFWMLNFAFFALLFFVLFLVGLGVSG